MHNKLKTTAALAATVTLISAAIVSASRSSAESAAAENLALVGSETASAFLALGTEQSPIGNEFVTAQRLLRNGKAAGNAGGACQIVAPTSQPDRYTFHCTVTLRLAAGQIAMDGLATFGERGPQPMTMAITGGTGSYRTARGQATVNERGGGETHYRISIKR